MPAPDPHYERTVKERLGLMDALQAAATLFEEALRSGGGREALGYAEGRGISRDTIEEFRIGYAPGGRDRLKTALLKKGFTEAQLLDAGLIIKPDDGRPTYDRFRDRLTIPILDIKSRVIAFGARALAPDAQPKYLNSPGDAALRQRLHGLQLRPRAELRLREERADRGRRLYGCDRAPSGGLQECCGDARHRFHRAADGAALAASRPSP